MVKDGEVLASDTSSPYPGLFHADSKAISKAFQEHGVLHGATLYVGLEPCLMCMSVAYWSGIRRIVYAIPKSKVSSEYYETAHNTNEIINKFNEPITLVHVEVLESEALQVIRTWEKK